MLFDDVPQTPADGGAASDDTGTVVPGTDEDDTTEEKTGEEAGSAM